MSVGGDGGRGIGHGAWSMEHGAGSLEHAVILDKMKSKI